MGYIQVLLGALIVAVVHGDYQGPSDYRRPSTSYGTPTSSYGAPSNSYNKRPHPGYPGDHWKGDEKPKSYQFGYAVKDHASGNDFGRHESSDGDTVKGQYRVQLPDGRTQIVTYTADWQHGFQAVVTYEGEAHYPDQHSNNNINGGYDYNNNNNYNSGNNNYNSNYNSHRNKVSSHFGSKTHHSYDNNNFGASNSYNNDYSGSSSHHGDYKK